MGSPISSEDGLPPLWSLLVNALLLCNDRSFRPENPDTATEWGFENGGIVSTLADPIFNGRGRSVPLILAAQIST